jgi:uroporphyrin-III C-methyltransferase
MSDTPHSPAVPDDAAATGAVVPAVQTPMTAVGHRERAARSSTTTMFLIAACALSVGVSGLLWFKLSHIQEVLARQSADASAVSVEAKTLAKAAQEAAREAAARQSVMEAKLSEVALQRTQLEELMKSLSRSRDENLVVDIESAIRLAQQQAQLTGSAEPLLAALKSADQRISRAALPRLNPLQRAIAKDIDRVKATALSDTPGLLVKLDELARLVDDLPLANGVPLSGKDVVKDVAKERTAQATRAAPAASAPVSDALAGAIDTSTLPAWMRTLWAQLSTSVRDEARTLVRVSRIDKPEAALLTPEQSFFVRENLKLKILNARLGLLARQIDSSRADLVAANATLTQYFDASSRKTQTATALVTQVQSQMKALELPRVDDTYAALTTAAAGR